MIASETAVPDGDGSGRRARDGINVEVFRLEDSRRHHGGRRRADADGVVASQHANRGEVSVGHNYLGNQLVVVAHGRADPFSVSEVFGDPFLGSRVRAWLLDQMASALGRSIRPALRRRLLHREPRTP